jgi:hypothetical protein
MGYTEFMYYTVEKFSNKIIILYSDMTIESRNIGTSKDIPC